MTRAEREFGKEALSEIYTQEDRELIWLPAVDKIPHCPKCDSARLQQLFEPQRDCAGSWYGRVDMVYAGHKCMDCGYIADRPTPGKSLDSSELIYRLEKSYEPYAVHLHGNMGLLDLEWFMQNNSNDIRDYPHRRKL